MMIKGKSAWLAWMIPLALAVLLAFPVTASANFSHKVADGDTLWDIAVKYDVSLTDLLLKNGLSENDVLSIGTVLTIPSEYDFDYTQVVEHKVAAGECLSVIAGSYGVSTSDLAAFNGLGIDDALFIDQVLTVPPHGAKLAPPKRDPVYYIVRPGDSAWLIARNHDVPIGALLTINSLTENSILTVGQRIELPDVGATAPERGLGLVTYTVRPGDCLSIIADKHDIKTSELCEINDIDSNALLRPGQILRVPGRSNGGATKRPPMVVAPEPNTDIDVYDAEPLPPLEVPAVNSPAAQAMQEGSSVFDFTSRQEEFSISGYFDGTYTYYCIQSTDCLSYLADCFGLTVSEICEASNLTDSDYIIPGQIIKFPGKQDVSRLIQYREEFTNTSGQRFAESFLDHLGTRYKFGGNDLAKGIDCSGMIWVKVREDFDVTLPRSAKEMAKSDLGFEVAYDALIEGDLVFFHTTRPGISHVGVYLGNGKFVHASSAKSKIAVGRMDQGYYKERFIKAIRLDFI